VRHFYGVTVSNEKKENFITGIKEIKDIKATTYADYTLSIMKNVSNMSTNSSNPLEKVLNFMTDHPYELSSFYCFLLLHQHVVSQ
jgi:hypothetical protein